MANRMLFVRAVIAVLPVLGASSVPAWAEVVRFDITETSLGFFGQQFAVDYFTPLADVQDMQITNTRLHLEFNTAGVGGNLADAANIAIDFQPPTVNLPILTVSGADLGWQGQGQFIGDFETDFLNEPILDFSVIDPPPDFVLWFARIISLDDNNPQLGGQFSNSFIEVELVPIPEPATFAMSSIGLFAVAGRRRRRHE